MIKKLALYAAGLGALVLGYVQRAHAQFTVSTSTANTDNGQFLTTVYDRLIATLGPGGVFLFVVVMVILGIIVRLAWRKLRSIFH